MPTYIYECDRGHRHEINRYVLDRDEPFYCPLCNRDGEKALCRRLFNVPGVTWNGAFGNRDEQVSRGTW